MDIIQELKSKNLKDYIESKVGQNANHAGGGTYRFKHCPICGGGDHFNINTNENLWNTFNHCGGGSIIDFYMSYYKEDKKTAISNLCREFNIKINKEVKQQIPEQSAKTTKNLDLTSIINNYYTTSQNNYDYFAKRLLNNYQYSQDTIINNFDRLIADNKIITGNPKLIFKDNPEILPSLNNIETYEYVIPVWENGKVVNCILRRNDTKSKDNVKTLNLKGQQVKFINADYLKQPEKFIFITEGVFDCLSIECMGYKSICLNSVNMANKLIELIKNYAVDNYFKGTKFIIALDNDTQGVKATKKLSEELKKIEVKTISFNCKDYKDINDYYLGDLNKLQSKIDNLLSNDFEEIDTDEFYKLSEQYINYNRVNTGFKELDEQIKGILPGLYVLGADTGLGKTTFMLQIADYIASTGKKVLFYSLEMSKFEMYCKSMTRMAYSELKEESAVKTFMFNQDSNLTAQCLEMYKPISKNLNIIAGNFSLDINGIVESIEENIDKIQDIPVIFIDYLQVIESIDYKLSDKQNVDIVIKTLKQLSRSYFMPIFVISSLNRQSYHSDMNLAAFKESGNIEYTADVMLGLQYKIIDELKYLSPISKKDIEEVKRIWAEYKTATKQTGITRVKLKCLKHRFGQKDWDIEYNFHSKFNYFEERDKSEEDVFFL